jgi:hypothetical protein
MSRIDLSLNDSTDADLTYDPLVDDDAELRAGFLFPWSHASVQLGLHEAALKPPSGGGGGGGGHGGGGGSTIPPTQASVTYAGPSFQSVGTLNGAYMIPPDSASAVSESAVILATNGELQVYTRGTSNTALTKIKDVSLDSFFGTTGTFDPRVVYDSVTHKLVVVAVDQNAGGSSHIHIAVSDDATAGHFTFQTINTALTVNGVLSWADFPQVGLDGLGNLYLTANMFDFASSNWQGGLMWIANETTAGATVVDPSAAAGVGELFSLAPTATATGNGNYLVSYNSARAANGHNLLDVLHVDSAGHATHAPIDVGPIDQLAPGGGLTAPQPGTATAIMADDSRTASVVYKNGYLYVAASILPSSGVDAGHTTAHWWVLSVDATSGAPALVNQGDISGNTYIAGSNLRSYYPSLAVDDNGNMAVSFSGSGPTNGTGYTGNPSAYEVLVHDAAHTATTEVGGWQVLEAGVANYVRTFGGPDNRWGDYSSISLDPQNPGHFWAFNEYAMAHGISFQGQNGVWGTELGYF